MDPQRVLVIDDEVTFLLAVKKVLGRAGLQVDTASTAGEAEELLERQAYDSVIADIRLSGSDSEEGLAIAGTVKRRRPSTKVILITAYGSPETEDRIAELGVDSYFEKPVPVELLRDALKGNGVSGSPPTVLQRGFDASRRRGMTGTRFSTGKEGGER